MLRMRHLLTLVIIFTTIRAAFAGVGDPTVRTDHPHYPGEGAFQTAADCAAFATRGIQGEQNQAIAMYKWLLAHQWHLYSPQECFVPGVVPGSKKDDYEMVVYDAAKGRFSYGYGLCGTVHAWNEPYWRALGMNARRRAFPGHTNSEIFYGNAWHAFDTDMAGLVFRKDGVVAGYDDVIRDPSIVKPNDRGIPCYPFAWPGDFNGMKKGWEEVAKAGAGKWFSMYNSGYEAMPGIVNLRRGETYTRYYNRDYFGGPARRRFWHQQKGGPQRDWSFFDQGEPKQDVNGKSNARGDVSYANAEFVYVPDLLSDAWREGAITLASESGGNPAPVVQQPAASPKLRGKHAQATPLIFTHFAPYVICGDPEDDENPMTGKATGGLVVSGKAVGDVAVAISTNSGQSWQAVGVVSGEFEKDLTELAKGRYQWWVRFELTDKAGLDALRFVTVCQMNPAMYPRLKPGGCEATVRVGSRAVAPAVPDFGESEDVVGLYESRAHRSANVKYLPRSSKQRLAFSTTNNKPAQVAFRVLSPRSATGGTSELLEVAAAGRFQVRVPPPPGCDYRLDISTDSGRSWKPIAKADVPADNEYSSGWVYGHANVSAAKTSEALVRVNLYAGGYATGLIAAEFYGIHRTSAPTASTITFAWKEGDQLKTHSSVVKAGAALHTFAVPTGRNIVDEYVRIAVP